MNAHLTLIANEQQIERWCLDEGEVFRVGRAEDNHARPKTRGLSRYHSQLVFHDGLWFVKDLGSTNGSWVNGDRIPENSEAPLESGDMLLIGGGRFLFEALEPRLQSCPICGEGMIFDEKAILANGLAREGVLLCVRCGATLEETEEGSFLLRFVPRLFAARLREIRNGPLTLEDMEEIGRDAVASLDVGPPIEDTGLEDLSDVFTVAGGEEEEPLAEEDDEDKEDLSQYVRQGPLFDDDLPVAATGQEDDELVTAEDISESEPGEETVRKTPSLDKTVEDLRRVESPVISALAVIEEAEQREGEEG